MPTITGRSTPLETPLPEFEGGVAIGVSRTIVVAESETEARRIARAPFEHLHDNQMALRRDNARKANTALLTKYVESGRAADFDEAIADGADYLVVGRPIVHSDDPAAMAARIIEDMKTGA